MKNPLATVHMVGDTKFTVTKWCKSITDDGKDWHRGLEVRQAEEMPHRFRLLDGDGEVYAYGRCTSDSSFLPLDLIGSSYGCTMIEYYREETKQWEVL